MVIRQREQEQNTRSATDDATRILPTAERSDATSAGGTERGAVIGNAGAPADRDPTASREDARPMPGVTIYMPNDANASHDQSFNPVVGWLVVRKGPGRGSFRPIFYGQNSIGRGSDQRVSLDFGDHRISRQEHAFLIYDDVAQKFYVRDGGKTNLVRHNGELVMTPTQIQDRDELTIGGTTLLFVALCGPAFDWLNTESPRRSDEASKAVTDESDH
jgi:hypothetical protein